MHGARVFYSVGRETGRASISPGITLTKLSDRPPIVMVVAVLSVW